MNQTNIELFFALLEGFIFYTIVCSILYLPIHLLKQHYLKTLCKYGRTREKPGRACVVCSYNHQCERAKQSPDLKGYYYWRKMNPVRGKNIYDEIWEEELKLALDGQKNSLTPYTGNVQGEKEKGKGKKK